MKKILSYAFAALALLSCAEEPDKNVTWPEWASRPIVENAVLSSDEGRAIIAGAEVRYSASVHDQYNELKEYTLTVKYGSNTVISLTKALSGNEASIEEEFTMPFAAYLEAGEFYPEVSLAVSNIAGGSMSQRLANDKNLSISRPASPEKLYIVDNLGNTFALDKTAGQAYSTAEGTDLSSLGTSFHVAASVTGGKPDWSSLVWGMKEGKIVVGENLEPIRTPDSGGYGFKTLGFDLYTFEVDKLVKLTVTLNKDGLTSVDQGGVQYLAKEHVALVQDCEIVFEGFGALKDMLQPDRFEILNETSAKFTGHSQNWSFWYDVPDNWMIVNCSDFHVQGQIWVTGVKACFPLGNDSSSNEFNYLKGDGKDRYASLSAVKDSDSDFRILLYLKEDFALQLYTRVKWAAIVKMTTADTKYGKVTDDAQYIMAGSDFVPGVYELKMHVTTADDSSGVGMITEISLEPYTLQ